MDHQDRRKRAFSQAFQRLSQPRHLDSSLQPAKRISSHSSGSTDVYQQAPLPDQIRTPDVGPAPGTQVLHPQPSNVQQADSIHYNDASLRLENVPRAIMHMKHFKCPEQSEQCPTPMFVRGESMFGPRPSVRPSFDMLSNRSYSQESSVSDASGTINSPSSSSFGFDDLSLNSRNSPTPPAPPKHEDEDNRTTVRLVPTSSLECHFPHISPNEVTILFDRGREIRKIDKYPLCAASRTFAKILEGPFSDNAFTRCIRLRDDLPYAITIMLYFVETGSYVFDPRAFTAYPRLTALDLHIHAYLVSTKYGITALRDRVIETYLETADQEMTMGLMMLTGNQLTHSQLSDLRVSWRGFPVVAPADEHCESETPITPMDRFLNSLVLLWKNTRSRHDEMRQVVLALIKRDLNKLLRVPLFVAMMQEVVGFGDDVVASLDGDGLGVRAFQVAAGPKRVQSIFFGP